MRVEGGHCFIVMRVIPHYIFHIISFNKKFLIQKDVTTLRGLYHLDYRNKGGQLM
jgi:hypothetical protein